MFEFELLQNCILRYLWWYLRQSPSIQLYSLSPDNYNGGRDWRPSPWTHLTPAPSAEPQPTPTKNNPIYISFSQSPLPPLLVLASHDIKFFVKAWPGPASDLNTAQHPSGGNNEASRQVKLLCCLKCFKTQNFLCFKMTLCDSKWLLFLWIKNHI